MTERKRASPIPEEGEQTGKTNTGLGGNEIDQSRRGASVDEDMLTKGERRRGGQDVS